MFSNIDQREYDQLINWADYIIVGAGASGCVVAARLAENPNHNILILELGPNNYKNKWIETPSSASLLWEHPNGPRPSPSSLAFETCIQTERKYRYPRGTGLGGSINHHSMIDGRGSAKIYDNIAELVQDDHWSYEQILPYYKKMEKALDSSYDSKYHGKDGWLSIRKGTVKSPFYDAFVETATKVTGTQFQSDMSGNPNNVSGIGISDVQIKDNGKRSSSFEDLLIPIMKKNKNIKILFNTLVSKIIFDDELKAIGVQTINQPHAYIVDRSHNIDYREAKYYEFYVKKEIILCGGAINTPQILMLSGIGPQEHLEKNGINVLVDSPGVGSNLMDHNEASITFEIDSKKLVWPAQAATLIDIIDEKTNENKTNNLYLSNLRNYLVQFSDKQEQKEGSGGIVFDWFSGVETDIGHDLHIHCSEKFMFDFDLSSNEPLPDGKLRSDYFPNDPYNFHVYQHYLVENLRPTITLGTIRLASSDPRCQPIIDLALDKDDLAIERMALGFQMIRKIVNNEPLKNYYKLEEDGTPFEIFPGKEYKTIEDLKYYIKRWSAFGHHISGTAKMGIESDDFAVVNSRLQVYGVKNLRVIDTSVYPSPYLHGYNTSRGAYLVGELGADFIKDTTQ